MTNREIVKYLKLLNSNNHLDTIFLRCLGNNIFLAKVWGKLPKIKDKITFNFAPYTFYFIKNETNVFVGAVLDMYSDLHWYITPEYRKREYLSKALSSVIIPHLFYQTDEIQITINKSEIGKINYANSKKVAESLGFKLLNKSKQYEAKEYYILRKNDFDWTKKDIVESNANITPDRIDHLRSRVNYLYKMIWLTMDELEMSCGDSYNFNLLRDDAKSCLNQLDNIPFSKI